MFSSTIAKENGHSSSVPVIYVSGHVKNVCSVYIEKGRFHSTASKLFKTKAKCMRIGREL